MILCRLQSISCCVIYIFYVSSKAITCLRTEAGPELMVGLKNFADMYDIQFMTWHGK